MTDVERAVNAAKHFEGILRDRYLAVGNGLGQRTRSVSKNLPPAIIEKLNYVARTRNELAHERVDAILDPQRFDEACAALEQFFKEAVPSIPEPIPDWVEPIQLGVWPTPFESSEQKRLYSRSLASVTVHPPGTHRLRRQRHMHEAGHVTMIARSLPRIVLSPLLTKDHFGLTISVEISAAITDSDVAVKAMILAADQQLETLKSQMLLEVQRICAARNYDDLSRMMHEIADELRTRVNEKVTSGHAGSLIIVDCTVTECELEDDEIEETRRLRQRSIEKTRRQTEEQRHIIEHQRLQQQAQKDMALHEFETQELKFRADRAKGDFDRQQAEAISQSEVEIQKNKAEAGLQALKVVEAKAKLADTTGGQWVLFTEKQYEIERQKIIHDAEREKSKWTARKVAEMLNLAAAAGYNQAQMQRITSSPLFEETISPPQPPSNDGSGSSPPQPLPSGDDTRPPSQPPPSGNGAEPSSGHLEGSGAESSISLSEKT
jgi:hypothetical protein